MNSAFSLFDSSACFTDSLYDSNIKASWLSIDKYKKIIIIASKNALSFIFINPNIANPTCIAHITITNENNILVSLSCFFLSLIIITIEYIIVNAPIACI